MILKRVLLWNVGAFQGEHEILFDTTDAKPLILVGGMNGAGKTTLFNSILLCLYGRGWEAPQAQKEYEAQLRSMTYRGNGKQPYTNARIEVTFQHTHLGQEDEYTVKRSWVLHKDNVKEDVEVLQNGEPADDIDRDYWNQFIRELIPRGVSNLFFFDGEKVKDLASDDEAHAIALREAFDALLGLDVVEQLRTDLATIRARQEAEGGEELNHDIKAGNQAIADQRALVERLDTERLEHKEKADRFRAEADRLEEELSRSGGVFATKRDEYKEKHAELVKTIKAQEERLAHLATGVLPFALAPSSTSRYVRQIHSEREAVKARAAADTVSKLQLGLKRRLTGKHASKAFQDGGREQVLNVVDAAFQPYTSPPTTPIRHGYSMGEADSLTAELSHRLPDVLQEAMSIGKELKRLRRQLKRIESFLTKIPDESEALTQIQDILGRLAEATRKAASFEVMFAEKQRDLEAARAEFDRLEDDVEKLKAKRTKLDGYFDSLELATRCRQALRDYQDRLRSNRRGTLRKHLEECLRLLTNKEDTYQNIDIGDDLRLIVHTREGKNLDFAQLSAGERQILATALLWALSKTSGRPLPFVIDTPLGRLDSAHRGQLVERFYPQAGRQVIILSTDTEIHEEYAKQLAPHVGRSYLLRYDPKKERTTVEAGYFGGAA